MSHCEIKYITFIVTTRRIQIQSFVAELIKIVELYVKVLMLVFTAFNYWGTCTHILKLYVKVLIVFLRFSFIGNACTYAKYATANLTSNFFL